MRAPILSGGELGLVGQIDGRLMIATFEHGYNSLFSHQDWFSPPWFYPTSGTLGYTDTYLLSLLPYSLFRAIGASPLNSITGVIGVLSLLGYWGFFVLLRRLNVGLVVSCWGALLFVVGAPIQLALSNTHIQLLAVWLVPMVIVLFWNAIRAIESSCWKAGGWLAGGIALFGLIAVSYFYTAWNFSFAVLLSMFAALVLFRHSLPPVGGLVAGLSRWFKPSVWLFPFVAFVLASILFLSIYLPVRSEMGGRHVSDALASLPELRHLGIQSRTSIFWSEWLGFQPKVSEGVLGHEVAFGFPWFFLATFLTVAVFSICRRSSLHLHLPAVLSLAVVLGWIFLLRVGECSLWVLVFEYLPAADSIRAVFRINMVLYAIALVPVCLVAERFVRGQHSPLARVLLGALALLLVVENVQRSKRDPVSNAEESALLEIAMDNPPPDSVRAFFGIRDERVGLSWDALKGVSLLTHVESMRLADYWGIPTINGYSGQFPKGWYLELRALEGEFLPPLKDWIHLKSIEGEIGVFNLERRTWSLYSEREKTYMFESLSKLEELRNQRLEFGRSFDASLALLEYGFGAAENTGRWLSADSASLYVRLCSVEDVELHVEASYFNGSQATPVYLNGVKLGEFDFDQTDTIVLPAPYLKTGECYQNIEFRTFDAVSPASLGLSGDNRNLKLWISSLRIQ
ncbi:hypothetical protein IEN85_18575 [Pelagicoccus sp. NFK12]|uniref:Uncharacterized protein n=1 Tax=Pelagicoccus enzymogenes TaxID=2773457 RepID=A0A927IJ80_9BACT|nr:hypothetical protein [Pelagicoccus enzymogenes]MBD5781513.1 hypothetical protein [Pelagicoccus enzymogenes]